MDISVKLLQVMASCLTAAPSHILHQCGFIMDGILWHSWHHLRAQSYRADSRYGPSLLCNDISHWLGASLELTLVIVNTQAIDEWILFHNYTIWIKIINTSLMGQWVRDISQNPQAVREKHPKGFHPHALPMPSTTGEWLWSELLGRCKLNLC